MEGLEPTTGTPGTPDAPGVPNVPAPAEPGEGVGGELPAKADGSPLTPERVAELRERVRSGAYDAAEVVDEVARRLLASGDL
jgi:hypothetical protein